MKHPLENFPNEYRKRTFFTLLTLTLILFAVFSVLDQPLRTSAAPNGIVSLELAGTPERAFQILLSWAALDSRQPDILRIQAYLFAAFGLGLDYLFMPVYAFALAFGTLLAAQRHSGWIRSLGALAGYGAFAAALFDAVENFALWQVLLGAYASPYPGIAALCATVKFALIVSGLLYSLAVWLSPKKH
jgi:hypothetical protein